MPNPTRHVLPLQALTAAAFAPFGQVIEADPGRVPLIINDGFAQRYDSAAQVDTAQAGGLPRVCIYRAQARALPLRLSLLERHRLGSQLFMPLGALRFVVVVARAGPAPDVAAVQAFLAQAGQGVNLSPGTWHHPLLALDEGDFLVLDRAAPDGIEDCELHGLDDSELWLQG